MEGSTVESAKSRWAGKAGKDEEAPDTSRRVGRVLAGD